MMLSPEGSKNWFYAAECASKDGFTPGTSAWIARIRELLPIVSE